MISDFAKSAWTWGSDIVKGLVEGIMSGVQWLKDTVKGLADGVANTFKDVLGINSPSVVFAGYGENITEGVDKGIESGSPGSQAAVESYGSSLPGSMPSNSGGSSSSGSPNFYITITTGNTTDSAQTISQALIDQIRLLMQQQMSEVFV
jgi:phage-related protein